jgi:hypothetical protein
MLRYAIIFALIGCSSAAKPAAPAPVAATAVGAEVALPGWLAGHWVSTAGSSESWVTVGEVMVGFGAGVFEGRTTAFEVMILHRLGGKLLYTAIPNALAIVDFAASAGKGDELVASNPEHDHPKSVTYRRQGDELAVRIDGDKGEQGFVMKRAELARAEELETLDRAFNSDNAERGGAAWAERFEPLGVAWSRGGDRTVGTEAIAGNINGLSEKGLELRWSPSASGMSAGGDMGFTTGEYHLEGADGQVGSGVYVTIWRRGADGRWLVHYDGGVARPK